MPTVRKTFRIGRVKGYRRGQIWYLCYFENGRRRRLRAGLELDDARKLAAQVNAQLETGAATAMSFEAISIPDLCSRWLDHHEHVLRSSVHTIKRYRTATDHLLNFVREVRRVKLASQFAAGHAEEFVQHLRSIEVALNGHKNSARRRLLDKGIIYILESCRAMFTFAGKRRHLSPYAENPFRAIEIGRIPIENAKPIVLLTAEQERGLLQACDDWQFPVFLTLMLTGLRPGELVHLLLPEDLDLDAGVLRVRNKPALGWQVKTRTEREIPLIDELVQVLRVALGARSTGPVFRQRRCEEGYEPPLRGQALRELRAELDRRVLAAQQEGGQPLGRKERLAVARTMWRDLAATSEDRIRVEFIRLAKAIGLPQLTMPKILRHQFATSLQDANVDPLIRNQLMGHSPASTHQAGGGLGMTAVYTHSRPETVRRQLVAALTQRPAVAEARLWVDRRRRLLAAR